MKILITGGTGFVGKNLVSVIGKKKDVYLLSRRKKHGQGILFGDLLDYKATFNALKKKDVVVHLAFSKKYAENILMSANLIKASKKDNVKKIILVSSMAATRNHPDDYGKTKRKIEEMIKESGLNYTIIRPSIIYGKGSTSFDFMVEKIRKLPFVPIVGSGRYYISPVHIKDVTNVIYKCVSNHVTDGKEYDLPGGEKIFFIDLINELKKSIGIKKANFRVPVFLCKIISLVLPQIISKENIENLTEESIADIRPAEKDLQYNPIAFSEGVKDGLI